VKGFVIEAANRPGELARVAAAMGSRQINIAWCTGTAYGGYGAVGILTQDEQNARAALDEEAMTYHEVDVITFNLPDRPGTLAEATRKLAEAGVNVQLLVPTGWSGNEMVMTAGVDDAVAALQALSDFSAAEG
jgi:hypothetical protein